MQFRDALNSFEIALEYEPESKWAWSWKGDALRRLGQFEEALRCYDRSISLDTSYRYIFPYIGKGDIYCEQKLFSLALSEYDKAIRIKNHPWALNGKAQCLYETGIKDQALRLAEEVIWMRPSYVFSHILVGDILFDRGSYNEAIPKYEKALSLLYPDATDLRSSLNNKIQHCQENISPSQKNDSSPKVSGRESDIPTLMHLLSSGRDQERADASYNLDLCIKEKVAANIMGYGPLFLLEKSLDDRVSVVRRNVLWILGNLALGGYSYEVAESGILNHVASHLQDTSEDVRSAAAWSLAVIAESGQGMHVAETGMIGPCIKLLDDTNTEVREMAAFALDKVAFYAGPEPLVRENAVVALASHIMDAETSVREKTLWALWSVASGGYSNNLCETGMLITTLKQCAQSDNLEVRKAAISIIGELSTATDKSFLANRNLEQILLTGISSQSNRVRGASVWAVGKWVDAGLSQSLIQNGVKDKLRNCCDDQHQVHVFSHSERRWEKRSIGGIAEGVLKKFNASCSTPVMSHKSDYREAYSHAREFVMHLKGKKLLEARITIVHLETCVSGPILTEVQKQRDNLDYYLQNDIDEISDKYLKDAVILQEMILAKAME